MINFEKGLKPDKHLKQKAQLVADLRKKLDTQMSRLGKQGNGLHVLDAEIDELLESKALKGSDPDDMFTVKRKIAELRAKRADELELHLAIQQSVENLKKELSEATTTFSNACKSIVGVAAQEVDDKVRENLKQAMQDYCATFFAKRNGFTMIGAAYEMEQLSFERDIEKGAQERILNTYQAIQQEAQQ